ARLSEVELTDLRVDHARSLATQALQFGHTFRLGHGLAERALGRVALAETALDEAETRLGSALTTFAAIGARLEAAHTHLDLAAVHYAGGRPDGLTSHLEEARRLFQDGKVSGWLERVEQLVRNPRQARAAIRGMGNAAAHRRGSAANPNV